MKRTMNTTTRKGFWVTLTADEVLERLLLTCSAPKDAEVRLENDGSATIHWKQESTSPVEVW